MHSTPLTDHWQTPWDEMDAIFPHEPAPVQQATWGGEDEEPLDGPYLDGDALVSGEPQWLKDEDP